MIQSSIGQVEDTKVVTPEDACKDIKGTNTASFCDNENVCLSRSKISCIGNGEGYPEPCPAATPFCVSDKNEAIEGPKIGKCSATKSPTSFFSTGSNDDCKAESLSSFTCTALTFFPDPIDCQTYHECSLTNTTVPADGDTPATSVMVRTPKLRNCRPEYAYNPITQVCDLRFTPGRCTQIKCADGDLYKYKPYGTSKQYFAMCVNGPNKILKPTMYSCPDNTIANIGQIPYKCDYVCRRAGFFTNSLDSTKYFECYLTNGKFMSEEGKCDDDKIFQEDRNVLKKNCIYK